MTYRFPIVTGDRVAIAPHHDLWMAGCRFGTVTSCGGQGQMGGRFYFVDLDTGRNVTLSEEDLLGAVGPVGGATRSTETCSHYRDATSPLHVTPDRCPWCVGAAAASRDRANSLTSMLSVID